jgi:uncharacterized membrane protein YecN with MAPEG domain
MAVPVIALYGPLNAFFNIFLANRVSNFRRGSKVSVGDGDNEDLLRTSRAHGNNAEFVPFALLMLLIAELMGGKSVILHVMGGSLLLARVLHAIGIHERKTPNAARFIGTALTWTLIVASGGYALYLRF